MSGICGFDLDEDLIARSMQGIGPVSESNILKPLETVASNDAYVSSIGPVAPKYTPILPSPKQHIMLKAIEAHNKTEALAKKRAENFEVASQIALNEIDRLNNEKEEAFRKEMEAAQNRDSWSTLSIVCQYIASVSAIALSTSLPVLPGILLGLSGVAGGTVRLLNDTHLMEPLVEWLTASKELQTSIKENIDAGAIYLQMGLGLAGGFAAWQAGAFATMQAANAATYVTKASSILGATSQVVGAGSQVGKMYYEKHMKDFSSDGMELDLGIKQQQQELTHQTKVVSAVLEENDKETEQIRNAIKKLEVEMA